MRTASTATASGTIRLSISGVDVLLDGGELADVDRVLEGFGWLSSALLIDPSIDGPIAATNAHGAERAAPGQQRSSVVAEPTTYDGQ
jgi:hypothetical protein